jgi:hypothetical protein
MTLALRICGRRRCSSRRMRGGTVNRRLIAIALWAFAVLMAGLFFGGGRVAPCLGLGDAQRACVAAWEASHPAPPAMFDITLPWPWLALFVMGLIVIVAIDRLRATG